MCSFQEQIAPDRLVQLVGGGSKTITRWLRPHNANAETRNSCTRAGGHLLAMPQSRLPISTMRADRFGQGRILAASILSRTTEATQRIYPIEFADLLGPEITSSENITLSPVRDGADEKPENYPIRENRKNEYGIF